MHTILVIVLNRIISCGICFLVFSVCWNIFLYYLLFHCLFNIFYLRACVCGNVCREFIDFCSCCIFFTHIFILSSVFLCLHKIKLVIGFQYPTAWLTGWLTDRLSILWVLSVAAVCIFEIFTTLARRRRIEEITIIWWR